MRLKGIKIKHHKDETIEVVPVFWSTGKGTIEAPHLGAVGHNLKELMATVVARLLARKDLTL